jgi:hypothetical protein
MRQLPEAVRCKVHLVHADRSEDRCILHRDHQLQDTDHRDKHGHHAPVLVCQATIDEVRRVTEARRLHVSPDVQLKLWSAHTPAALHPAGRPRSWRLTHDEP